MIGRGRVAVRLWAVLASIFCVSNVLWAQEEKGRVVEEIIARVNNDIITLSEYRGAETSLQEETTQDCAKCTPEQFQDMLKTRRANLLRDMIDQSLLAQKGKDLGLNVESDVVKRLDQLRQQYGWKDMDDMEAQLRQQGISLEDYKQTLRNQFLTQEVVRQQVSSHITITHEEIEKFYQEHQSELQRPEQVVLSEFFLSTEKKPESDIPGIEEKSNFYLARVRRGESFESLAKLYSEGSTSKDGGFLGSFQRGQLSKEIEDKVFAMKKGDVTDVIRTKTGFLFLLVLQHYEAGLQPLDKVRGEIENKLVYERTQPELRKYLATLREQSYLIVKPGFTDTAAVSGTQIVEVDPAAAPADKASKKSKKSKKSADTAADSKPAGSGPSR